MKSVFFKKMMPLFVFVLGIAGAFSTMSMKGASSTDSVDGWAKDQDNVPCQIRVSCQTEGSIMCRHNDVGEIAYLKTGPTSCPVALFKVGS